MVPGVVEGEVSGGKKGFFASLNRNRDGVGLFHWWGLIYMLSCLSFLKISVLRLLSSFLK